MKRKPSMRTEHNRKVRKLKHEQNNRWSHYVTDFSGPTTITFHADGLVAGDYITISDDSDSNDWGVYSGGVSFTVGSTPRSPKSKHPARKRKAKKEYKKWNNRIEQSGNTTITTGSSSVNCKKINDDTWIVMGNVTI